MAWIHSESVILEVQKHPCLYNTEVDEYKSREERKEAWISVTSAVIGEKKWNDMNEDTRKNTVKAVLQRWRHMKDNYIRNLKLIEESKKNNTKPPKPYTFTEQLAFLHFNYKPKRMSFKERFIDKIVSGDSETSSASEEERITPKKPHKRKFDSFEPETVNKPKVNVVQPSPVPSVSVIQSSPGPIVVQPSPGPSVVQPSPGPSVVHPSPGPSVVQPSPGPSVVQPAARPDPDEMFLLSQLPVIRHLNPSNKLNFQVKFLQLLQSYASSEDS